MLISSSRSPGTHLNLQQDVTKATPDNSYSLAQLLDIELKIFYAHNPTTQQKRKKYTFVRMYPHANTSPRETLAK